MKGEVLSYASIPSLRPRQPLLARYFHFWLLPLVWLVGGWGSRVHHGDEFVGFAMAQFPSVVVYVPLSRLIDLPPLPGEWGFRIFVATGFVMWAVFGWLLDRVRAWRWMYLLMPAVFVLIVKSRLAAVGSVQPIIGMPQYPPGLEWTRASMFVAYCWTVYAVALVAFITALIRAATHWCAGFAQRRRALPTGS